VGEYFDYKEPAGHLYHIFRRRTAQCDLRVRGARWFGVLRENVAEARGVEPPHKPPTFRGSSLHAFWDTIPRAPWKLTIVSSPSAMGALHVHNKSGKSTPRPEAINSGKLPPREHPGGYNHLASGRRKYFRRTLIRSSTGNWSPPIVGLDGATSSSLRTMRHITLNCRRLN